MLLANCTADTRNTATKLAAKMKADDSRERPKVVQKTTPEKPKVVDTEFTVNLCLYAVALFILSLSRF